MKKFMSFTSKWAFALLLATFVAGCGSSDNSTTITADPTPTLSSAKAISSYSLNGASGTIKESAKTILVTMPYDTNVTALVATFITTGEFVDVGVVEQESGVTANDFTLPVDYLVTAVDGSFATYTVTVEVALFEAKAITSFSIRGVAGSIDEAAKTIDLTLRSGTDTTALVAKYTTTGSSVAVNTTPQISTLTANDFSSQVEYLVTAGDSTTATYIVTVTLSLAQGPVPVNLGTAGNFVILAKTSVTTTGTTAVVGDVGVSPIAATAMTGFDLILDASGEYSTSPLLVTGRLYAADYADPTPAYMTTAVSDMEIAFTDAAGRSDTDYTELYAGDISGQNLVPGLYKWGTGVLITSAGVTLEGGANDVWIFQIAQDLTVNNSAMVTLLGEAQAKNIFWQVSGQATLGTTADFKGIILSQTLISLNTGAVMNGRALAQTAVTLNATAITEPSL